MEEHNNIHVSSRGILKSCDYYSLTPYSSIKQLLNYLPLENIKTIKNPSIYICSSAILHFINSMLPLIDFSFILVSGDCDETVPQEILNNTDFFKLVNDTRLIHWFCQNMTIEHDKITRMPIGLDYHTLTIRPLWGPLSSSEQQEKMLLMIKDKSLPFWNRNIKCYANFHFTMNTKLGYDRKDAVSKINKELIYYEEKPVSRLITWNKQKDYSFVICPHGGGLDCHRNWEALCLGCIPIVKTSAIDNLYNNLPVLIVKDWQDISIELLNETISSFKDKFDTNEFNIEKLKLSYWLKLINSYK
jgi:hypothetical protein